MKRTTLLLSLVFLLSQAPVSPAQSPSTQTPSIAKPEEMAREWFVRLNELDDWYISFDGKEANDAVVARFLELYAPGASHQVGPSDRQIGAVVFYGKDAIRKWADEFSKKFTALNYRVEYKTKKEQPLQPFYVTQFPWGGTGAAAQFEAIFSNREDRRQFVVPAAVFFMFDEAGKIQNVRLYMLRDEAAEIG